MRQANSQNPREEEIRNIECITARGTPKGKRLKGHLLKLK